jgi:hypothetical protein
MQLRSCQEEAVDRTLKSWGQYDRLLGVAPVGAGKTVFAAALIQAQLPEGPALFLAHRDELPSQAIDKLKRHADWMDLSDGYNIDRPTPELVGIVRRLRCILPGLPKPGKDERRVIIHSDRIGDLPAGYFFPFVEAVSRNPAPPLPERFSVTRGGVDALDSRIDGLKANLGVLGPAGHKPLTQGSKQSLAGFRPEADSGFLAGRDIPAVRKIPDAAGAKIARKIVPNLPVGTSEVNLETAR